MIDAKLVASKLRDLLRSNQYQLGPVYTEDKGLSLEHLMYMIDEIESGKDVDGEKAHRWLGWLQCALVARDVCSLDEMKALNKSCKIE